MDFFIDHFINLLIILPIIYVLHREGCERFFSSKKVTGDQLIGSYVFLAKKDKDSRTMKR